MTRGKFQFAIDRGGTFTDVWARRPNGGTCVMKLLSEDPANYPDAPREGIRRILQQVWLLRFNSAEMMLLTPANYLNNNVSCCEQFTSPQGYLAEELLFQSSGRFRRSWTRHPPSPLFTDLCWLCKPVVLSIRQVKLFGFWASAHRSPFCGGLPLTPSGTTPLNPAGGV